MYSIAFKTHTKTTELIEMPFGMMSGPDPEEQCVMWGDDTEG